MRTFPFISLLLLVVLAATSMLAGCRAIANLGVPTAEAGSLSNQVVSNPASLPVRDHEFFWNQLVDTVDDYFDIRSEQQVQVLGGIATQGRIETRPRSAATVLEPWQLDSTPGYEKWHATLQSLRRRAVIEVTPQGGNYLVHVIVEKALEDVDRPVQDTPGSFLPRHDNSLMRMRNTQDRNSETLGWVPLGRDPTLEQEILRELQSRLYDTPIL